LISKEETNNIVGDVPTHNLKKVIRMDDYGKNSIRECQIAIFYKNDEDEELYVKTLIISRSIESAGE